MLAVIPMVVFTISLSAQPQKVRIDSAKQGTVIGRSKIRPVVAIPCCVENPWELTMGAKSLLEAMRDLITGTGVKDCFNNKDQPIPSLASIMPIKYYNDLPGSSQVSFVVYYTPNNVNPSDKVEGPDRFRFSWSIGTLGFTYYGTCIPEPFLPLPNITNIENHVYAIKLFPINQYRNLKTAGEKNFVSLIDVEGVKPADIAEIMGVFIEPSNGYIATTEKANYEDLYSSKGLVVVVKLKKGQIVPCYLINNYEYSRTIKWKQQNACRLLRGL